MQIYPPKDANRQFYHDDDLLTLTGTRPRYMSRFRATSAISGLRSTGESYSERLTMRCVPSSTRPLTSRTRPWMTSVCAGGKTNSRERSQFEQTRRRPSQLHSRAWSGSGKRSALFTGLSSRLGVRERSSKTRAHGTSRSSRLNRESQCWFTIQTTGRRHRSRNTAMTGIATTGGSSFNYWTHFFEPRHWVSDSISSVCGKIVW